jgi:hypothetical protein
MGLDVLFGWILDKLERAAFLSWVYPWQRAVRICGGRYKEVGPGFHFKLPWAMEFHDEDVTWRQVQCPEQKVCSSDGTTWLVTLAMELKVADVVRALVKTHDYEESVVTDAQSTIAEWVNATDDGNLTIEAMKVDCLGHIRQKAKRWGCRVRSLGAVSFAPFDYVYCVVGQEGEVFPVE